MNLKISFVILGVICLGIRRSVCEVKSSLTFVIDDTGSMQDDINQVKKGVDAIFDTVIRSNSSQIEDFVLVTFNDPASLNKLRAKTKDRNVFKDALSSIVVDGGGLCPETAMSGIKLGLQNSLEGSSIYVFTDASADDYEKYDEVEALSQKMGCQIVFVLTGYCTYDGGKTSIKYKVYKDLAKATNGQVFHLGTSNIKEILKSVQESIESRKHVLARKTFPAGYGNTFDIPVDADTKELVISVSGLRPKISVTDSDGTKWPTTDIFRLEENLEVKVVGVTPDVYTVEVGSEDESHVLVRGSTTVHFQHGFSIVRPSSIEDTVTRPLPGNTTQHLSIKLSTEGEGEVQLRTVQLLDMDDEVIMERPLTVVDKTEQFYTTELMDPPDGMFKVAITGYDVNSKTFLKRISLTPVKAQEIKPATVETKPPKVECKDEVTVAYDKQVQLKCKVSGFPRPDVIWVSDDKSAVFSHEEYTIELPYDYLSVLTIDNVIKNATYSCKAVNSEGSGEGSTSVRTKMNSFFDLSHAVFPKDITVEYQKPVEIPCQVNAYPPAKATWYRVRHTSMSAVEPDGNLDLSADGSILTIRSMQPNMADNYICEVRNEVRRKIFPFRMSISGVEAPEINKEVSKITVVKGSNVVIICQITKGKPDPTITWYYKNTVASNYIKYYDTMNSIRIPNADSTHTGSYRCMAENVVDWTIHDTDLVVEYKPTISRPDESVLTTNLGESVTLTCPAVGEPTPSFTWRLNGEPISSTERHYIYADGTLSFYPTSSDEGNYECEATNKHGVDRIQYKLYIHVPVDIESPKNSIIEQMEGTTVTLPCRADGTPKPTIRWIYRSSDPTVRPNIRVFGPSDASGALTYNRIQLGQSGEYTCVATNSRGSKNITYEVSVLAPPKIHFTAKEFQGVVGDMQLQIPCNATGNPKPDITWTHGGYKIASGSPWYEISAEGSLIIKNVDRASTGYYTCKASNKFMQTQEDFSVHVSEFPDPGLILGEINLKTGESVALPCTIPHRKTDRLLWFKDGRRLPFSELRDVTEADSGTYTCRVSSVDRPAQSRSTRVSVGVKPSFDFPDDPKELSFAYGEVATMDCTATGVPKPEVKWYHDGREIELKEFRYDLEMFNDYDKGIYTCVVSNSHASIQQEFVISSFECLLDVTHDFNKNEPLMLTVDNRLPKFKTSAGYMRIPKDEPIKFVCPTRFNTIRRRELTVTCEKEQQFVHQPTGRHYTYSDLRCRDKWEPTVKKTGHPCSNANAELYDIGYEIRGAFQTVYGVCFDRITKNPIYTKLDMQPTLSNAVANNDPEWFNYESSVDLDGLYDCTNQNAETSAVLNREFHRGDGCCFAKRMLVNPVDVAPGLQAATYTHLNVAPHWGTCDSTNWEELERRVRKLVASADRPLQVFTGTAYSLEMPDAYSRQRNVVFSSRGKDVEVPRYLWKVVQDASTGSSLAIIQVNVPDLKLADAHGYQLCKDVCKKVNWMQDGRWRTVNHGFTYCCSLDDFERAFRMRGVFPAHRRLLTEVSALPDDHYLHASS